MQTECNPKLFEFEAVGRRAVVAQFDGGTITSNAGALLLGQVNRGLGLTRRFAQCFTDRRDQRYVEHSVETLVGQRVFGLALGCEDLNDHDELRKDPVFAVLAGKLKPVLRPDCAPVAGKSTLNRLEHTPKRDGAKYHKIDCNGDDVDALFVDVFLETRKRAPGQIVLDLDATDIPLHGHQEGRFFHGYYDNYCYLPLYVFCGRDLLLARLRRSNIDASAGAVEAIAQIVARIRRKWPRVRIMLRADSGFAREALMHWCETNRVDYVFGLARNARLEEAIAPQLSQAKRRCAATGKAARLFRDFRYRTLDSWSRERRVVGKAEHTPQGANPRFVVTSLRRAAYDARTLYEDLYRARRGRKPHRRAIRAVGRSRLRGHDGGQSAASVVFGDRLRPGQCNAPHRAARHPVCRCRGRNHPPQAAQARCPRVHQCAPHSFRHRFKLPEPARVRGGVSRPQANLQLRLKPQDARRSIEATPTRTSTHTTSTIALHFETRFARTADRFCRHLPSSMLRTSSNHSDRPSLSAKIARGMRNPG
jgi:hypothetical protein